MENPKYLSIITNFGCHYKCPYCIVKNNGLQMERTRIRDLIPLISAIRKLKPDIVSVSGGGDPIYQYDKRPYMHLYYRLLFSILKVSHVKFELHTSLPLIAEKFFPMDRCYRAVYHLRKPYEYVKVQRCDNEIVRIVYVVQDWMTEEWLDAVADFVKYYSNAEELSFRQRVDEKYQETYHLHDYLRAGHKEGKWHYIEQNDYNTYFANGKTYTSYREIFEKE